MRAERHIRVTHDLRGVKAATLYEAVDAAGAAIEGPRVAIVGHTHGNEPVGGAAIERFSRIGLHQLTRGSVLTVLNNLEAMASNVRHTPEGRDMNRLWDSESLARIRAADPASLCYEERRVAEVAPLLLEQGVVLDLHSTSRPSPPHLVFRDDLRHSELAGRLGVRLMVTGIHEGAILEGGLCADLGIVAGEQSCRLGFTLEAGQHTNLHNVEHAWSVVMRLLSALDMWEGDLPPLPPDYEVFEVIERFVQAPRGSAQYRFADLETEIGPSRRGPTRKLESFEPIEADEVLLVRGTREVVRAEAPFTMLMPAPTAGPGEDLFYFCQRRHASLQLRPQTDAQARIEASAIERFLDLLGDDECQRGSSEVSFHSRRTLDLCAEMITRVERLPVGHPHRRIAVIGRGDDSLDEAEARTAKRYQQAVTRALRAGVPVDRVQLLRGASFAWLRQLADMADANLRLFLSERHPHTLSLLLCGDPERAFAEGDFHHVRLALLVEAATVEGDGEGDGVRMRIARAGLFGSRPELIRVGMGLLAELRTEHCHLVADGALGPSSAMAPIMDAEGGLSPQTPEQVEMLRSALFGLQTRTWRQALRHEVTRPQRLAAEADVAAWLSRVMVSSGILDADAVRALAIRPEGDGWLVDPRHLEETPDLAAWLARAPRGHVVPDQVLAASDVDRNSLERWSGWKRFVREVQSVPGRRGRDLDLELAGPDIRARLAQWFDQARALAAAEPGRWQVVIAGEGLAPDVDADGQFWDLLLAHRRLVLDPNLRYQRIQHAQGTHLAWMKDFVDSVARRPAHGEPVAMCWEAEHGGSVNVVLVARLVDPATHDPWTLEGWAVQRCAVIVRDIEGDDVHDDQASLFTEPGPRGQVNQELLHFGRSWCEGLLRQAGRRISGRPGPAVRVALDNAVVEMISRWINQVRAERAALERLARAARPAAVARRLGLVDTSLAEELVNLGLGDTPAVEAARSIWSRVQAWPGPDWKGAWGRRSEGFEAEG